MWSVRRGVIDFAIPEPRAVVFGARLAQHFGGPTVDYDTFDYPSTAADTLDRLDAQYADWIAGVRSLDADEVIHHGGDQPVS